MLAYLCFAYSSDETLCTSGTRNSADGDFGLAKFGRFARVDDVAHHGELAATAKLFEGQRRRNSGNDPHYCLVRRKLVDNLTAKPLTAAMMGFRMLVMPSFRFCKNFCMYAWTNVSSLSSLMSAPADLRTQYLAAPTLAKRGGGGSNRLTAESLLVAGEDNRANLGRGVERRKCV